MILLLIKMRAPAFLAADRMVLLAKNALQFELRSRIGYQGNVNEAGMGSSDTVHVREIAVR
jgi:hypothetical protein